ncbi:hypothetical protein RB653_002890 [Dictyostelium firmibasis]|uniref:Uncharacterized protein n=1 Tax=Dictyostelium firmibasis TaxID=79012 RepID=A0AAN7YW00_9MYCE
MKVINNILEFNDKIISVFNSLDGRDKVFKFIQYFSQLLHHLIDKKYATRLLNTLINKKKKIVNDNNTLNNRSNNNNNNKKILRLLEGILLRSNKFNDKLVKERLKSLESSFCDARIVFRLFGFFREFNNLIEFFKTLIESLKQFKENQNQEFKDNQISRKRQILNTLKSFTNISSSFLNTLELIDHSFNFISELNDIIFWGTRIKIFEVSDRFMDLVCKVSNFVWVYSLVVFIVRIIYGLINTIIQILKLKNKNQLLIKKRFEFENKKQQQQQQPLKEEKDEYTENQETLIILSNNRINEIKSLISAIAEFGLCVCSIYEIENDGYIGGCGALSAFISLQEIWDEITKEKQQSCENNHCDNSNIDNNSDEKLQKEKNQPENIQFALVCPPIIHSSHN